MNTIGERFKHFRNELLRLSQKELANELELSSQAISGIENNKNLPATQTLIKLIVKYNLNINWLLTGEDEMLISYENVRKSDLDKKVEQKIAEALNKYGLK